MSADTVNYIFAGADSLGNQLFAHGDYALVDA